MTFDRPLWLLLLLAVPALWWLQRRLHAPREIVVASVEALRGAQLEATGSRSRRATDLDLWFLLGAVFALALAAAGPRWGARRPAMLVAFDTSASMLAPTPSGETMGDVAWERVRSALFDVHPELEVLAVDLDAPRAGLTSALGEVVPPAGSASRTDGLPGSLAPLLGRARAEGFPGVLLVTDRAVEATGDLVVSGPGVAAAERAGLLDLVLDGEDVRVTVLRAAGAASTLSIHGAERPTREQPVPVGVGPVVVSMAAPPRGSQATVELVADSGATTATVDVQRVGGVRSVRLVEHSQRSAHTRALLATLGIDVVAARLDDADAEVRIGDAPTALAGDDPPRLHLAASTGSAAGMEIRPAAGPVAASRVSGSGVLAEAAPAPAVALVRTGVVVVAPDADDLAGRWLGPDGLLAVVRARLVLTTLDPEARASRWHTDPSFPVFVMAALEHLAGGPDRLEILGGTPPAELRREGPPVPVADVARLTTLVRSPAHDPATSSGGAALAAAGAVLLLVVTLRGTGRFSSAGRR